MHADAEHQEHDAQFGQLIGQMNVGDNARRIRAEDDACNQIADQGRQAQAGGAIAEN